MHRGNNTPIAARTVPVRDHGLERILTSLHEIKSSSIANLIRSLANFMFSCFLANKHRKLHSEGVYMIIKYVAIDYAVALLRGSIQCAEHSNECMNAMNLAAAGK